MISNRIKLGLTATRGSCFFQYILQAFKGVSAQCPLRSIVWKIALTCKVDLERIEE